MYYIILLITLFFNVSLGAYTEETPVKLLEVESLADRYPATASEYRVSVTNGFDEDAHRTEAEALNGFPAERLILNPGGCAVYVLPVDVADEQKYALIHPARKAGDSPYENYCPKAQIDVVVSTNDQETSFTCFPDSTDCSSSACVGNFDSILNENIEEVELSLCVGVNDANTGAIWEINISKANESSKIQGVFMDGASERFQLAQTIPEFNKQLSLVSIVGARGVGKSTVTSLLSGNHSMFTTGSGSVGTTTTGADMSTIIPTTEYSEVMETQLGVVINEVNEILPLFLIDSEGMGVRGDAFDFITTSPPAVIAKVIIWIGAENLQTVKILYEINEYLNGLDNIIMDDGSEGVRTKGEFCDSPNYGHFVIVINKMMGDSSDQQLYMELMTPEPDYIPGADERNDIRTKLNECFDGISVHGLPVLNIESGQEIDYPILDERFKSGLAAMANTILDKTLEPRTVSVGGISLELNSTTAEVIISTVIEEANEGKIDLTGFQAFWKFITWKVDNEMLQSSKSLDISLPLCQVSKSVSCSPCACSYRNDVIEETIEAIDGILAMGSQQAMDMFEVDVTQDIADIYEGIIEPWVDENTCATSVRHSKGSTSDDYCDFTEMSDNFINPNNVVDISCSYAFVCSAMTFEGSNITISADNIYFSATANFDVLPPSKAANGEDAVTPGTNGGNGGSGFAGTSLYILSNNLLKGSKKSFIFTSRGGNGGDGGKGAVGEPGSDGAAGANGADGKQGVAGDKGVDQSTVGTENDPKTADEVYAQPSKQEVDSWAHDEHHCVCGCHEKDWWKQYLYKNNVSINGGDGGPGGPGSDAVNGEDGKTGGIGGTGGQGGNGGDGGQAGSLYVSGISLDPIVNRIGGKGGLKGKGGVGGPGGKGGSGGLGGTGGGAGPGGVGGMGTSQLRQFYCKNHHDESCDCGHLGFGCGHGNTRNWNDEYNIAHESYQPCCQGRKGSDGPTGRNGVNGKSGSPGSEGDNGQDGSNGIDA